MVYLLKCGCCSSDQFIESTSANIRWVCDTCRSEATTSFPTDGNGNLIVNPNVVVATSMIDFATKFAANELPELYINPDPPVAAV